MFVSTARLVVKMHSTYRTVEYGTQGGTQGIGPGACQDDEVPKYFRTL